VLLSLSVSSFHGVHINIHASRRRGRCMQTSHPIPSPFPHSQYTPHTFFFCTTKKTLQISSPLRPLTERKTASRPLPPKHSHPTAYYLFVAPCRPLACLDSFDCRKPLTRLQTSTLSSRQTHPPSSTFHQSLKSISTASSLLAWSHESSSFLIPKNPRGCTTFLLSNSMILTSRPPHFTISSLPVRTH
jgi:hypothetical protein